MEAFTVLKDALVAPLNRANVDTDAITPARYLRSIRRTGFARALFANWRYLPDTNDEPNPDFVLNQPRYAGVEVLIVGPNFGCGSSREHAPWSLREFGFRALIGTSFADIFYNNCFSNSILPVILEQADVDELLTATEATPGYRLTIDLQNETVSTPDSKIYRFHTDPFKRDCLLRGLDNIGWTLQYDDMIGDYEARRKAETPWLSPKAASEAPVAG